MAAVYVSNLLKLDEKSVLEWMESRCLDVGPAPEPCHSLTHHTQSFITEQQAAAGQAVGVKKNDKLQHLETICPHSCAFVAWFARLHCQFL